MKFYECEVCGNIASEKTSEQYPIVDVCEKCYRKRIGKEDGIITSVREYFSNEVKCYYCERRLEAEELLRGRK